MRVFVSVLIIATLAVATARAADPEIVVIGNTAAVQSMTKDELAELFIGKRKGMNLLDLPDSAPAKATFYQKVSGHDLAQVKAMWSRLIFTGKAMPPKELPDAAAVKKAVAADPRALGYIRKSDVDSSVKIVLTLS